jgi:Tfp pilus assembly protein PilF
LENLGTAQLRRGDARNARASFARALAIDPQREVARRALAAINQQ